MKDRDNAAAKERAARARTIATINKYVDEAGRPKESLNDATGFGEGVSSFLGSMYLAGGNEPQTMANQKELQLDLLEQSILEASKALKPVSVDEMKFLQNNRPKITDNPVIWAQYMNKVKAILTDPTSYQDGQAPTVDPRVSDAAALRGIIKK